MVPCMIASYQQYQQQQQKLPEEGCVDHFVMGEWKEHESSTSAISWSDLSGRPYPRERKTPVVLIFYWIVVMCVWFMDYQEHQHWVNVNKLLRVRQRIARAEAKQDKSQ
jgi:hypothetical protein